MKPIFEPPSHPVGWPPAPSPSRIQYVGQLRTAADLKPPPKPFEAFGNLLLGEREPARLYGPRAVVRTPDGRRLWIADPGGRCLHMMDLESREYLRLHLAGDEPLLSPVDVTCGDDGCVYVCDSESVSVHRFDASTGLFQQSLP
jgi:hypothetical protein